jgi:hypothetical protein
LKSPINFGISNNFEKSASRKGFSGVLDIGKSSLRFSV